MYNMRYLPIAKKDIDEILYNIADGLSAPQAAINLLNIFDKAISQLKQFPYSGKGYHMKAPLAFEYRMLPVKNYIVFYVVIEEEKTVEIHRVIYSKRDFPSIINEK